jgi:Animal haem peroxidase
MRSPDDKLISHGVLPTLERLNVVAEKVEQANREIIFPFKFAVTGDRSRFDFLLPALQTPEALLPESAETRQALVALGVSMREPDSRGRNDSLIPSAYTYLGQFVDHDITLEAKSDGLMLLSDPNLRPLTLQEINDGLVNGRQPGLDLDNVYYKPAQRLLSNLVVGSVTRVTEAGGPPPFAPVPGKDLMNDLARGPRDPAAKRDRAALVGDERNDENLIIAQLHVAFLRAHNAIAARGHTFDEARKILRRHYQWIVINDLLPRICDPWIVNSILTAGNRWFRTDPDALFMPLEFSVAAFRFGHSMVRGRYDINLNFEGGRAATLTDLFELTALSGTLKDQPTLPDNWIIQWENFVEGGSNRARSIDTQIAAELFDLRAFGKPMPAEAKLSVRNLLRGYMLRLPSGQAVAAALKLPVMSAPEIQQVARSVSDEQLQAVRANGFSDRTPLWYYILAEAAAANSGRLGPVGSTLVAEVLIGLARGSKDSILRKEAWQPWLGNAPGKFELSDLFKLAGVLN